MVRSLFSRRLYIYPFLAVIDATVQILFKVVFGDPLDWTQMIISFVSEVVSIEVVTRLMSSDQEKD